MEKYQKIKRLGIFDSGIGGLSILEAVKNIDCEEIIYIADTANLPYGDKSAAAIMAASYLVVEQLLIHQVDTIIVACHTASAIALPFLQEQFPHIQFIGMIEPTIQATLRITQTASVALLATPTTISYGTYEKLLTLKNISVQSIECPELVPLIEQQAEKDKIVRSIEQYTQNLADTVDTLILGCTHYDLVHALISRMFPALNLICAQTIIKNQIPSTTKKTNPKCTLLATGKTPSAFSFFSHL